jgi:hypothetical protein
MLHVMNIPSVVSLNPRPVSDDIALETSVAADRRYGLLSGILLLLPSLPPNIRSNECGRSDRGSTRCSFLLSFRDFGASAKTGRNSANARTQETREKKLLTFVVTRYLSKSTLGSKKT